MLLEAFQRDGIPVTEVDPELLMEAKGYDRTSNSYDNEALRWEVYLQRSDLPNLKYWVTSFITMTEIIKSGAVRLTPDGNTHLWADVSA